VAWSNAVEFVVVGVVQNSLEMNMKETETLTN
jgi:hypothetical protein